MTEPIGDPRFNGDYSYYETKEGFYSNDGYDYESYSFDGTNLATYYTEYWYWNGSDWAMSGDYKGDHYIFRYEIEVNPTHTAFRQRLWNNRYSDWSDWMPYEFSDDGRVLRIWRFPSIFPDVYNEYTRYDI